MTRSEGEADPPLDATGAGRPAPATLRRLRHAALGLLATTGAAFLVVAYTPLANWVAIPLHVAPAPPARADLAIVLAGGHYRDGSLNEAALERTVAAVRLFHQGLAQRLLFTGGPCCGESTSALMARLAVELGVPPAAILLEEHSGSTRDSAVASAALIRRYDVRSVALVTSTLHVTRARLAFAAAGIRVQAVRGSQRNLLLVSGVSERLGLLRTAGYEYLGLAWYRLRRWI